MGNRAAGLAMIALTGCLLFGCGGGKGKQQHPDGGSVHAQTSIGADEPLASLSGDEVMQLCRDVTPALTANACTALGIVAARYTALDTTVTDADLEAACRSAAADCQSHGGAGQPDCAAVQIPPAATCIATVGDYVACVNATVDAYPTCGQVTRAFLGGDSTISEPTVCQTLDRECPDFTGAPPSGN